MSKRARVDERAQVHRKEQVDLEAVYREHGARLWRALVGFTGDRELADETVSEAFAQALRRGDQVRDPLQWVWRTAFRIAAGELQRRRRDLPRAASADSYDDPEPPIDLLRALAALSPKQRGSVLLHHYAGYPVNDVARIIGSTSAAVRVHLLRGRRRLRELLEEQDDA